MSELKRSWEERSACKKVTTFDWRWCKKLGGIVCKTVEKLSLFLLVQIAEQMIPLFQRVWSEGCQCRDGARCEEHFVKKEPDGKRGCVQRLLPKSEHALVSADFSWSCEVPGYGLLHCSRSIVGNAYWKIFEGLLDKSALIWMDDLLLFASDEVIFLKMFWILWKCSDWRSTLIKPVRSWKKLDGVRKFIMEMAGQIVWNARNKTSGERYVISIASGADGLLSDS